jgi:hypothetical protein
VVEDGIGNQQVGSTVKQANTKPRALGSKNSKDENEERNRMHNDSLKPQRKTVTIIFNIQNTKQPEHKERHNTDKPKIAELGRVNKE